MIPAESPIPASLLSDERLRELAMYSLGIDGNHERLSEWTLALQELIARRATATTQAALNAKVYGALLDASELLEGDADDVVLAWRERVADLRREIAATVEGER
jgi:hypothetical protein